VDRVRVKGHETPPRRSDLLVAARRGANGSPIPVPHAMSHSPDDGTVTGRSENKPLLEYDEQGDRDEEG
jgi:hypothetical protein